MPSNGAGNAVTSLITLAALRLGKNIARAASPFGIAEENSLLNKRQNVTKRRVLRAVGQLRILRRRQFALRAIEQPV